MQIDERLCRSADLERKEQMKQWRCTICGYIHSGDEPPDKCPVCGAEKDKFVLVKKKEKTADSKSTSRKPVPSMKGSDDSFTTFSQHLTRLHAHPIAVHIPNGVLPVTVLFVIIAWLFNVDAIAGAARFNMFFICISMPAVIASGVIDWKNRYKARMTKVFRTKIICAAIVTILCLVLSIWWLIQPDIYSHGGTGTSIFILIHLIDLGAAGVAGWYGGKLIFPKK